MSDSEDYSDSRELASEDDIIPIGEENLHEVVEKIWDILQDEIEARQHAELRVQKLEKQVGKLRIALQRNRRNSADINGKE